MFSSFFRKKTSSRPSSFRLGTKKLAELHEFISQWRSGSESLSQLVSLKTPFYDELFRSSLELQEKSKNLVFYDRGSSQVREFPFPMSSTDSHLIVANGFGRYFKDRRLAFECFCGLKEDEPQYVDVKATCFGHIMSCTECGLYVSIENVRQTADMFAIYPSLDNKGAVQPVTMLSNGIEDRKHIRAVRRSQRRISYPGYDFYKNHRITDFEPSSSTPRYKSYKNHQEEDLEPSSPISVEKLLEEFNLFHRKTGEQVQKGKSVINNNTSNSSASQVEGLLFNGCSSQSKGKEVIIYDSPSPPPYSPRIPRDNLSSPVVIGFSSSKAASTSFGASTSHTCSKSQIKFCRFCELGMANEDLGEHEFDCWASQDS